MLKIAKVGAGLELDLQYFDVLAFSQTLTALAPAQLEHNGL